MKRTVAKILVGLSVIAFSQSVFAETRLTLSSWMPNQHPMASEMIFPWAKEVAEVTEGRVTVDILAKALGHPKVHYDIARDGLADITYSAHGYTPGRFLLTKVAEFPFSGNSAEAQSVAYWRVYNKYLAKANEHKDVKLLGLFTHGPGAVHNNKHPIEKVADFEGLKLRVGGGVVNQVATSVGAVPLLKPASKAYELLSHGVADGTMNPPDALVGFNIVDLVKNTTTVPGGFYNISFFLVMNKDRWNEISPEDQAAIESISGEAFAKRCGKVWDRIAQEGLDAAKANGNTITYADDAFVTDLKAKTAHIENEWIAEAKKKGVDGAAALAELRAIANSYTPE